MILHEQIRQSSHTPPKTITATKNSLKWCQRHSQTCFFHFFFFWDRNRKHMLLLCLHIIISRFFSRIEQYFLRVSLEYSILIGQSWHLAVGYFLLSHGSLKCLILTGQSRHFKVSYSLLTTSIETVYDDCLSRYPRPALWCHLSRFIQMQLVPSCASLINCINCKRKPEDFCINIRPVVILLKCSSCCRNDLFTLINYKITRS